MYTYSQLEKRGYKILRFGTRLSDKKKRSNGFENLREAKCFPRVHNAFYPSIMQYFKESRKRNSSFTCREYCFVQDRKPLQEEVQAIGLHGPVCVAALLELQLYLLKPASVPTSDKNISKQ